MVSVHESTLTRSRMFALERNDVPQAAGYRADVRHHRCAWAVNGADTTYLRYHDNEWGVPCYDDRQLFETLLLETARVGLSCPAILRKRGSYRVAFEDFDPARVAAFSDARAEKLLRTGGIVRHRQKVMAAINNARRFLEVQQEFGSFATYLWHFVDGRPVQNRFLRLEEVPARTVLSDTVSRDMRSRGFRYVGSRTVYAYLQATGVVNDHLAGCFRHACVMQLADPSRIRPALG
ncbi:MAG TPA: DNA-3-methyladenine glycosylase I [Gammaproteobacteria bacterium]|nr:DNA-3-methyladenine glycosylase I [Gammaproteobacteria bacterium]